MYNYTSSLTKAFRSLGYDVNEYIMNEVKESGTFSGKAYAKMQQYYFRTKKIDALPRAQKGIWIKESNKALELYNKVKPDLVISFAAYILTVDVLQKMKDSKKVLWIYDSIRRLPQIYPSLKEYDIIYTYEKSDLSFFEKLGIKARFLPLCVDNTVFKPYQNNAEETVDLSFIGSMTSKRIKLLKKIKQSFPEKNLKFYGRYIMTLDYWGRYKRQHSNEPSYLMNTNISFDESIKLYAKSKICLNFLQDQSKDGANMRLYELMACNTFQIVNWNPYIEENFSDCVETFKDYDELTKKIDYYLAHAEKRREYAKNGYLKCTKSETFVNRAQKIIDDVKEE